MDLRFIELAARFYEALLRERPDGPLHIILDYAVEAAKRVMAEATVPTDDSLPGTTAPDPTRG